jgi:hypothetical protein
MMKFKVISLDVWGHGPDDCNKYDCKGGDYCDGYTVNQAFYTGRTVEVPRYNDTCCHDAAVIRALVEAGMLTEKCLAPGAIKIDGEDDFMLFIDDAHDGQPLIQLERIEE